MLQFFFSIKSPVYVPFVGLMLRHNFAIK